MPGAQPSPGPPSSPRHDAPRQWQPSRGYLALALVVAIGGPAWWLMAPASPGDGAPPTAVPSAAPRPARAPEAATAQPIGAAPVRIAASAAAAPPAAAVPLPQLPPAPQVSRTRDPNGDLTPDLADYVNAGEHPTMAEVIQRLNAAGVYTGLGAFSPPGTRPPLIGLAVPEDFVLPEGYVRHYQATDDGQRIEPILMFSPDYRWYDAAGQPLPLPVNRVVPQEMAPPGLPIRRIGVPAPAEPGK